jgi:hypothetical protein
MYIYFLILLTSLSTFSCSKKAEEEQTPVQNNHIREFIQKTQTDTLEYLILSEGKIDGKQQVIVLLTQDFNTFAKSLIVKTGDSILYRQTLPSPYEYSGFATNWVKKTDAGFSLSIEYGTRYYYEQEFLFELAEGNVSLVFIKTKSFDKFDNGGNLTFKQVTKSVNIPIKKFNIISYIK